MRGCVTTDYDNNARWKVSSSFRCHSLQPSGGGAKAAEGERRDRAQTILRREAGNAYTPPTLLHPHPHPHLHTHTHSHVHSVSHQAARKVAAEQRKLDMEHVREKKVLLLCCMLEYGMCGGHLMNSRLSHPTYAGEGAPESERNREGEAGHGTSTGGRAREGQAGARAKGAGHEAQK